MSERLTEIETRLAEIRSLDLDAEGVDLEALTNETNALNEERAKIMAEIEQRKATIEAVTKMPESKGTDIIKQEEKRMAFTPDSAEYREAFLNNLRGVELSAEQRAALDTSTNQVIPTTTLDKIIEKVKQEAPLLDEITLVNAAGQIRLIVEGTINDAAKHTENASITPASDTFVNVVLGDYEIIKQIKISGNLASMSVDAFESWIVSMLAKKVASKITDYIINGTGTLAGQPAGLASITFGSTNSVTVAAASSLTAANVRELIAMLPGGYDANAKFLMSKKTFFNDFANLQDKSKNDICVMEGNQKYVYGYAVMLDERVDEHDAYLGDFTTIYGKLPEQIDVKKGYDFDTNSDVFNGIAYFDCQPTFADAFVKLTKATS